MDGHNSVQFSARWTSRIRTEEQETKLVFSSLASGGSRIVLDGAMALDAWEEWGSTFSSEPITVGRGYHLLKYEYRSAHFLDTVPTVIGSLEISLDPTNSFAVLSWSSEAGASVASNGNNRTGSTVDAALTELYVDVGWLACFAGASTMQGNRFDAGFAHTTTDLRTTIDFSDRFTATPMVFAGLVSTSGLSGHLRLLTASDGQFSLATEYDTCNIVIDTAERMISWMAIPTTGDTVNSAVSQRPTSAPDMAALLRIRELLGLPDYLQWHNGSDPCTDRWAGVECRAGAEEDPRVVVLDVRVAACRPHSS
jgi:hypothetical protein